MYLKSNIICLTAFSEDEFGRLSTYCLAFFVIDLAISEGAVKPLSTVLDDRLNIHIFIDIVHVIYSFIK